MHNYIANFIMTSSMFHSPKYSMAAQKLNFEIPAVVQSSQVWHGISNLLCLYKSFSELNILLQMQHLITTKAPAFNWVHEWATG